MRKNIYTYFSQYVLRTPINNFNYDRLLNIDHKKVIEIFKTDSIFKESVFLASKSLYYEIEKLINENKIEENVLDSLLRYYLRSCTRCTPFGLFAGCCIGNVGDYTDIILQEPSQYKKYARFDMELIISILFVVLFLFIISIIIYYAVILRFLIKMNYI